MARKKTRIQWVTPRRAAGVGCLVGLALAVAFGVVLYQQVRNLFAPYRPPRPGGDMVATQDVTVGRGSIADGVYSYGQVKPLRQAELGFRIARGRIVAVPVQPGQPVKAGDLLVQLDPAPLEASLAQARGELLAAQKELGALGTTSIDTQRLKLEVELRDARAALDLAQRNQAAYDAGKDTPQEKRARAAADLDGARAALTALQGSSERTEQLEQLRVAADQAQIDHGPYVLITNPSELDRDREWLLRNDMLAKREAYDSALLRYETDVRAAERKVTLAERTLRTLDRELAAGSPAAERAKRAAAVKAAKAAVQQAQARLAALGESTLAVDVAKAQAKVLKAEGKVADAEAALAEAALLAPFDGTVDMVSAMPETMVASSTTLVNLVDVSAVRIVASVSDIDVVRMQAGQHVRLSFDAFRGPEALPGRLGDIPLYGTYQNGQTTFEVPVIAEGTLPDLRPGMGANIFVPLEHRDDVLLVPAAAVRHDGRGSFVLLVRGSRTEERRVRLGASDGVNTEVLEGLQEDDVVRMPLQSPMGYRGG
ncbi:MAG TPA: efflux RND transporter periplasmic adaptor subunit [Anaerolineae bacterium]|nr:efflux RND transporter periplasmic adaptor subunit [Anaerolineae bacterium]HOR01157.1 efflux RND transporter periplasmic adaptor subunit [Anaerolineae bacterium]HPL27357.1 efflux RND transporter periplasmic adaptor subunit [Anaerolineae bacterium]